MDYDYKSISRMIDHSLLSPALTSVELEAGCRLGRDYGVAGVCVLPFFLGNCAEILSGCTVKPSTTVGFPHGGQVSSVKLLEAERALHDGAQELDAVVNVNKVLSGDWSYVEQELAELIHLVHGQGQKIKIIFENCYLEDRHKIQLCQICGELGADWVKTSTGYGTGGSTLEDVMLMRKHSPPELQVKAAGGIRDLDGLLAVRAAGVTRVGASATKDILDECRERLGLA